MKTEVIYCGMIERELLAAARKCSADLPMRRVEGGLHNTPAKLTERLQEELDRTAPETERVLLAFSFCGNALAGLKTGDYELIVPRADDCITLLLGSYQTRLETQREAQSYFLTEGWLKGGKSIWDEYCHAVSRYGERRAKSVFRSMLQHYKRLLVIDSGVSEMPQLLERTEEIAKTLSLRHEVRPGTLAFLEQLLSGPWDAENFLRVPPHTTLSVCDLILPQTE